MDRAVGKKAAMVKTVSGTCEDCGKPFKNRYTPSKTWEKSPSYYCPDCLVKPEPKWHVFVSGGVKNSQVNAVSGGNR
jgi:DNA-directed RNA polymerase subunit RPC12/RpoP